MDNLNKPTDANKRAFKSWRGEYTAIGLVLVIITLLSLVLDIPSKLKSSVRWFRVPRLEITNILEFQTTIGCLESRTGSGFCKGIWELCYEIANLEKEPVTITGLEVVSTPTQLGGRTCRVRTAEPDRWTIVEVYENFSDIERFFTNVEKKDMTESRSDRWRSLPITLEPCTSKYLIFHITFFVESDGKTGQAESTKEFYLAIAHILGLQVDEDGTIHCDVRPLRTRLRVLDRPTFKKTVRTFVSVPGCRISFKFRE